MSSRAFFGVVAFGSCLLTACVPYPEPRPPVQRPMPQQTLSSPEQQAIQQQQDELRKKEAANQTTEQPRPTTNDRTAGTDPQPKPKPPTQKKEYPVANKVPGKDGMVFSPYNNKMVDVRGIASGALVQDPTFPDSEKKYFRVP